MRRTIVFAYGIVCYLMFLGVFVYAIGFVGNIFVPNSLDATPRVSPLVAAGINLLLLTVFAVQHSVMARPTFKRWWTQFVPEPAERSTYVLFTNLAMIAMFAMWQPMGGVVWSVPCFEGAVFLYAMYGLGWLTVFYTTCLFNHFELFGVRQVYLYLRGTSYTRLPFKTPSLYRYVRHPMYVGWMMVFWFTPVMTIAHLLFALTTTAYILIAIQLEERNLRNALPEYESYSRRVPMLVPRMKRVESEKVALSQEAIS